MYLPKDYQKFIIRTLKNNNILFFVKYPELGKVKTRLASYIGENHACEIYRCFVNDIQNIIMKADADAWLCYTPPERLDDFRKWLAGCAKAYRFMPQSTGDLGKRMNASFSESFANGYDKTIVVGSDTPDIELDLIEEAYDALGKYKSVIGPSKDGGYYLLGFNKNGYLCDVFKNITWSTEKVLEDTINILKKNSFSYMLLPELQDIDTLDDLKESYNKKKNKKDSSYIKYIYNNKIEKFFV